MIDALYPLFSVFAFLGFVLALVPLPWHFQAWNSGTCFYMMWSALACLNQFVNSIVWADNIVNSAPVWCDISIRITMAASVGIPAASLCINRRLYQIASVKAVTVSNAEKRRAALIDTLICVLFPLVYVAMQYIVQGHRFNIYEQIGCYPALYNSIPMYFISTMWPPLIGLISAVYCVLSLRAFTVRRAAFAQFLSSATPGLTPSRYLRLMALAATAIALTTPLGIFAIYLNLTATPVGPWVSLSDTHFMFSRVEQIPALFWRSQPLLVTALEFTRWTAPLTALVFFAFFGFAVEARKHYRLALGAIASLFWKSVGCLGVRRPTSGFFASTATATSSSTASRAKFAPGAGVGYTKPTSTPPTGKTPMDISLPAYSPSGTGSFTAASFDTDLKRAGSLASSSTTSRFVERFHSHGGEEVSVSSVYSADGHLDADVLHTPASATSFGSASTSTSTASVAFAYALPLHLGWAAGAYPASPSAYSSHFPSSHSHSAHGTRGPYENDEREHEDAEQTWSPSSDAHSICLDALPPQESEAAARGRALV